MNERFGKLARGALAVAGEMVAIAREMLVIPLQLWLYLAEILGGAVLFVWERALWPLWRGIWLGLTALLALAERHLTPARATAALALAAAAALIASQWVDYRAVSVGTGAYAQGVEAVAPAPDVAREAPTDAHGLVMIAIAAAAIAAIAYAVLRRPAVARLLILAGIAVIAIGLLVDRPEGLDEGTVGIAYEGTRAHLLEGFWAQLAAGAVLGVCGFLLPVQLRVAPQAGARRKTLQERFATGDAPAAGVRARETRASEVRAAETRASDVRAAETRASEVRAAETRPAEWAAEPRPPEAPA